MYNWLYKGFFGIGDSFFSTHYLLWWFLKIYFCDYIP